MRHLVFRSTLSHFGEWYGNALSDRAGIPYPRTTYLSQEKEDVQSSFWIHKNKKWKSSIKCESLAFSKSKTLLLKYSLRSFLLMSFNYQSKERNKNKSLSILSSCNSTYCIKQYWSTIFAIYFRGCFSVQVNITAEGNLAETFIPLLVFPL